jgi:predicted HicB family RNase H-like nuclease
MSQERRDHQLTIRIPQRIRDAIGAQAEAERRSVADVVNNALATLYPAPAPKERRRR